MSTLITGSGKGLGAELSKLFDSAGHEVIRHRRSGPYKRNDIAKNKEIFCDLLNIEEIEKEFSLLNEKKLGVTHLICNAGKSSYPPAGINNILNIRSALNDNLVVSTNTVYCAMKFFRKTLKTITLIGSICGEELIDGAPLEYSVAKSALKSFTKLCAHRYGDEKIRFNMITPGNLYFEGSVWQKKEAMDKLAFDAYLKSNVPSQNIGTPTCIFNAINFLISDSATFLNGENLVIDGSQTKKW